MAQVYDQVLSAIQAEAEERCPGVTPHTGMSLDDLGLYTVPERVLFLQRVLQRLGHTGLVVEGAHLRLHHAAIHAELLGDLANFVVQLVSERESEPPPAASIPLRGGCTKAQRSPGEIAIEGGGPRVHKVRDGGAVSIKAPGTDMGDSWTTQVFFATDRAPAPHARAGIAFGAKHGDHLTLGRCEVSIPARRKVGQLRTPKWWRLEFSADPRKHFFLKQVIELSEDEFYPAVAARLEADASRDLLMFVHGYNVTFESAALRTAQLALDLKFKGAPILYSWPSRGRVLDYPKDVTRVTASAFLFMAFLEDLVRRTGARQVHVLAHSIGNQAVCNALHMLSERARQRARPVVGHLALAAADIDADVFRRMAEGVRRAARTVTLYASSRDLAIQVSKRFNGGKRAGEPLMLVPEIDTVDASAVDTDFLAHGYFSDDASLLQDLYHLLRGVPAVERFSLVPQVSPEGPYFAFRT